MNTFETLKSVIGALRCIIGSYIFLGGSVINLSMYLCNEFSEEEEKINDTSGYLIFKKVISRD